MKLRNHTFSSLRTTTIVTFAMTGVLFGFLAVANISRNHDARVYADEMSDDDTETISDTHFVTIHENGESLTIKTDARTVEDAVNRAKIELAESDIVDPAREEIINSDNYHINIYRARPVTITDGITKKYLMSASYDAETIAKEAGFTIYDGDKITSKIETKDILETGLSDSYIIKRHGGKTITVEENIPYTEKTEQDGSLNAGQQKVKQIGELGKKVTTYRVRFVDEKEVERVKVSEEVTKNPVDRITAIGTKVSPASFVTNPDRATCESWIRAAGVPESQVANAYWIIEKESHCRYNAENRSSGAYGIPQALPGRKMASAGSDWKTNPVTQIKWMNDYVKRYGGWSGAVDFWKKHHWY